VYLTFEAAALRDTPSLGITEAPAEFLVSISESLPPDSSPPSLSESDQGFFFFLALFFEGHAGELFQNQVTWQGMTQI